MTPIGEWFDQLLMGTGIGGGVAMMLSYLRKAWSRNGLDTTQFDSLAKTLTLVRQELEHERRERVEERREWRAYETALKSEIIGLKAELVETREKLNVLQASVDRLGPLQ